ncbi:Reverse transcriptase zinc-binding domain [Arabidopsis suecica]|uniref:Reverse transcriptase zinc-binding domain n=1 Tax=Arabidopsis suecica TaxID=45249 RepID=A0A8T2AHS7_ARASU|nr:Reverse transcriptase zinc-binding domain [Arabidopsis suecica]
MSDGRFTVKTAYSLLVENCSLRQNMASFYDRFWRVTAPERVRTFIWLVCNQAIMTNAKRYRRHLGDTSIFPVCKCGEETILQVLRDCPSILGIRNRIVPPRRIHDFFNGSLLGWVYGNLASEENAAECAWSTIFAMGIWWAWKWRCSNVFGEIGKCRGRVKFVNEVATKLSRAYVSTREGRVTGGRVERMIAWKPPSEGWIKLNTDGASHGNPGVATAGGVF